MSDDFSHTLGSDFRLCHKCSCMVHEDVIVEHARRCKSVDQRVEELEERCRKLELFVAAALEATNVYDAALVHRVQKLCDAVENDGSAKLRFEVLQEGKPSFGWPDGEPRTLRLAYEVETP